MRLPCVGLFLMLTLGFCHISYAGTLTIIERESSAANNLFAGSGGATDISNQSDSTTALTGAFSFSDSGSVAITGAEPFANGSASASGSITVADNVVQSAPYSLSVTASRTASGMASYGSGTGIAQSYQNQEMRVRFTVNGDNATYKLTGDFDPGVITTLVGEAHTLSLRRPFTSQTLEIFESAATIDEMGELIAGRTYEFRILLNDRNRANANDPSNSDMSSFNIRFDVTSDSIPEPSTISLMLIGAYICWAALKRARCPS